jgi:hypothetical protein
MPNDLIRLVAKAQGLALSARLPAPLALRLRALAGWLFQPITRRRLVAITAGSLLPGFQFPYLTFQLADFAFQGQQQVNYYFWFPAAQLYQLFSSAHSFTLVSFPFCATSCSSFVQLLSKYYKSSRKIGWKRFSSVYGVQRCTRKSHILRLEHIIAYILRLET